MKLSLPSLIALAAITAQAQQIQLPEAEVRSGIGILHQSTVHPQAPASRADAPLASLKESFEGTDGTKKSWLPQGWSRIRTDENTSITEAWVASTTYPGTGLAPSDGKIYMTMLYPMNNKPKDEWLVTPLVSIKDGMELKFDTWFSAAYFFFLDKEHYDGNTGEFIKREVASSFQIWVQPDGGEWTMAKDFVDDYMDMSYDDMAMSQPTTLFQEIVPLSDFAGHDVRIGFRYKAVDGNIIFLDNVKIEYPLIPVSYQAPLNTLYFGFAPSMWSASPYDITLYPVFTPLTWTNTTGVNGASYKWRYADPVTGGEATTSSTDLTVEYHPYYEEGATSYTNYYSAPILEAKAQNYTSAMCQDLITAMKMGGDASMQVKNTSTGETMNLKFGLIPFNISTDGLDISVAAPYDYGESGVPIFGHSDRTRQWWTENTLQAQPSEGSYAEATGYMNYFEAPGSPLVVNGLWTLAKGQITENAEFVAEIFAVNSGNISETPIARATCRGSEIEAVQGGTQDYLTIPFSFAQPAVLSSDTADGYYIMISGYADPQNVTWFAPIHSMFPRLDGVSLGMVRRTSVSGDTKTDEILPLGSFDGDYGALNVSFAICLDAYYPWLKAEKTEVEIDNATPVEIALDSYHDAKDIAVTCADGSPLPEWLTASVTGRYDKAALTLSASAAAPAAATVLLSAPGISSQIEVKATAAGIRDAMGENASPVTGIYTPAGIAVDAPSAPGIYILRHADGSISKVLRK